MYWLLSEIYQSLKILREMNATEVAQKYPATRYKFLVYWILKARNVGMNQTRWRSSIFHSTGPRRISTTLRFISQNSMVCSLTTANQWKIERKNGTQTIAFSNKVHNEILVKRATLTAMRFVMCTRECSVN